MKSELTIIIVNPYFKNDFIYFLERREGREKERERNINMELPLMHPLLETWPATQACALAGNRIGDPLVHRPTLNPWSYTSQGKNTLFKKRIIVIIMTAAHIYGTIIEYC